MVDEIKAPEAPVTAVETTVPVPTSEITSPAPAASPAEAAPSSESKTEIPVQETPKTDVPKTENILGGEPVKTESKEIPKTEEAPKAEVKPEVKAELPVYDEFKLPENVKLDKEPLDSFTRILGEIETGKLDHKGMQDAGQKLVDLAIKNTTDTINRLNDSYVQIHQSNVQKRVEALKADPELGGDKFENTVATLQQTIREYGGTESQIAEFRKEITESGLGASPAVCRLIYNMQQKINKYTTENDGPSIVPGAKPAPVKVKPYEMFYQGNRT